MPYHMLIHLEDGTELRSPEIAPNQPKQDRNDIEVMYYIHKYICSFGKLKEIKKCEAVFEE